jgi:hypothetical protein
MRVVIITAHHKMDQVVGAALKAAEKVLEKLHE